MLKKYRISKGLSQRDLARKSGYTQGAICNWESGRRELSYDVMRRLANVLDIEPWQLLPIDMQPINAKEIFMAKNKLLLPFRYIGFGVRNALAFILRNCFDCMVVYPLIKKGKKNAK